MPRKGILKRFIVFSSFLSLRNMKDCLPQNATLPFSVLEKILKWRKKKGGGREISMGIYLSERESLFADLH